MKKGLLVLTSMLGIISGFVAYGELRDPTQPFSYQPVAVSSGDRTGFQVSAILTSAKRRLAAVNGQFVRVGDKVSEAEVIDIQPDQVEFKDANGKFVIHLYQSIREVTDTKVTK